MTWEKKVTCLHRKCVSKTQRERERERWGRNEVNIHNLKKTKTWPQSYQGKGWALLQLQLQRSNPSWNKTKGRTEPPPPTSKGTNGETGVPGGKKKIRCSYYSNKTKELKKHCEGCSCLESSAKESKRQWVGDEREFHPERSKTRD